MFSMGTDISEAAGPPSEESAVPFSRWEKREKLWVGLVLAVFLVAGVLFLNPYLTGSDEVCYISIAQKYARGEIAWAINGYWAPLYSWLLAPLLLAGLPPVVAYKILTLVASAFLLLGVHLLSRRFSLRFPRRMIVLLALGPALLFCFSLIDNGPDILATGLLVAALVVLFDPQYLGLKFSGAWFGALGAAAFLAKSYSLLFFFGLALFFHLYVFLGAPRGAERKRAIGHFLAGLAVFLGLSGGWLTAVGLKYGRPTISVSSKVNLYLVSPYSPGIGAHPMMTGGLYPPPDPEAVSAWEDPTIYLRLYPSWSPFRSGRDWSFWLRNLMRNIQNTALILFRFSPLAPAVLLAGLILAFFPRRHRILFLAVPTLALYTSGYVALFVIERYLILDLVLIVLMGAYLLELLAGARRRTLRASIPILTAAYLAGFLILPYQYSRLFKDARKGFVVTRGFTNVELYRLSRTLRFRFMIPPGAKMASNADYSPTHILASYLDLKYYGIMTPRSAPEVNRDELSRCRIDYVFYWSPEPAKDGFLATRREITRGRTRPLWVYSLHEEASLQPRI